MNKIILIIIVILIIFAVLFVWKRYSKREFLGSAMDKYSGLISSKFFKNIDDFKNLMMTNKIFENFAHSLHFNPVSVYNFKDLFNVFPNLETYYVYTRNDLSPQKVLTSNYFNNRIYKIIVKYPITYDEFVNNNNIDRRITYVNIVYTKQDRAKYGDDIPYEVDVIGESCFKDSDITEIDIPENVKIIGAKCFEGCENLSTVNIPEGLESIGKWCFNGCVSLNDITLPKNITSINKGCFSNCSSLTKIVLPKNVKRICEYAFECCENLAEIVIPEHVEVIKTFSFFNCGNLTSINIPNGTIVEDFSFQNCPVIVNRY